MTFKHGALITYLKYGALQLPVIAACTFFYMKAGWVLISSKADSRKRILAVTLALMCLVWVLMSAPYNVQEVSLWYRDFGTRHSIWADAQASILGAFFDSLYEDDGFENSVFSVFTVWLLLGLKQSFAFVNSVILLVLIRPFQAPIIVLYERIFGKKNVKRSKGKKIPHNKIDF